MTGIKLWDMKLLGSIEVAAKLDELRMHSRGCVSGAWVEQKMWGGAQSKHWRAGACVFRVTILLAGKTLDSTYYRTAKRQRQHKAQPLAHRLA